MRRVRRSPAPNGSGGGEGARRRNERGAGDGGADGDGCGEGATVVSAETATIAGPSARAHPPVRGGVTSAPARGDAEPNRWAGRRSGRRRPRAPPAPAPRRRP